MFSRPRATRPFHDHARHQRQSHDEREQQLQYMWLCGLWQIHTTQLCTSQPPRYFWQGPRLSWICFRHGQRQRERPSSQVVFCVVSQQRKLCSVGMIGGAPICMTLALRVVVHVTSLLGLKFYACLVPSRQVVDIHTFHILRAARRL